MTSGAAEDPVLIDLADARGRDVGGKAAPLGELLRAGFDVPSGFVVPAPAFRSATAGHSMVGPTEEARAQILRDGIPPRLAAHIDSALARLTRDAPTPSVAVRSSSSSEDTGRHSAAGQHDSVLAVQGGARVCAAIATCWASLWTGRAIDYRARRSEDGRGAVDMAVLVQQWVDARVSGVMFTEPDGVTTIEATWGIGEGLVSGRVTPDTWTIDDGGVVARRLGTKAERGDRVGGRIVVTQVSAADRSRPCLGHDDLRRLHHQGARIARVLGGPRDIEWALDGDRIRILQARPVTADLPTPAPAVVEAVRGRLPGSAGGGLPGVAAGAVLRGVPGAMGTATGPVRHVRGPWDFRRVRPGDVLVCRETDPAWTPLFTVASAVVTEAGGVLSHAAIVAREVGIPAVLAVPGASLALTAGARVRVDGSAGTVRPTVGEMSK